MSEPEPKRGPSNRTRGTLKRDLRGAGKFVGAILTADVILLVALGLIAGIVLLVRAC